MVGASIGVYFTLTNLLPVMAATINWNLNTSGEYTFDSNDIEFTGGVAQLKPTAIPGTNWITSSGSNSWGARRQIIFNNSASTDDLVNFQVLITLDGTRIDYAKVQDAGEDLRFTDSDGLTELDYEIERWDESGDSFVWVKIPQLDNLSTTDSIYMYYANQNVSDGQDDAGTWNTDFSMVYHYNEAPGTSGAGSVNDSTSNTSGTPASITFGQTGQIGLAPSFAGSTGINVGSLGAPLLTDPTTISFWIKMNSYSSPSRQNPFGQAYGGWGTMTIETSGRISWFFGSNGTNASPYGSHQSLNMVTGENGNWVYVTAVRNPSGDTYTWYKNGQYLSGTTHSATYPVINTRTMTIGDDYVNPINGIMDEFRVAQTARSAEWIEASYLSETDALISSVGSETLLYPNDNPTIVPNSGQGYSTASLFAETLGSGSTGNIKYQISPNNGTTWYWYTGGSWTVTTSGYSETNTAAEVNTNISTFSAGSSPKTLKWRAYLNSDGGQLPKLDNIQTTYIWDTLAPDNPSSVTSLSESGGSSISASTWYNHDEPYFSWTAPSDNANTGAGEVVSGVAGYWVCFGAVDCEPTSGTYSTNIYYEASLSSSGLYYLRIKTQDNAGNINATAFAAFTYWFDNQNPVNPAGITPDPAGFSSNTVFDFTWTIGSDTGGSGVYQYCYKTGDPTYAGDTGAGTDTCVSSAVTSATNIPKYKDGPNIFYVRTKDTAGNLLTYYTQTTFYYSGAAPTPPQGLTADPSTNTDNSFTFDWFAPASYSPAIKGYYYSVNQLPSAETTTFTTLTSVGPGAFATQQGSNLFYVVAQDTADNIEWTSYASVEFTANTIAPGIPTSVTITDSSIRAESKYLLTITWNEPADVGSGIDHYVIERSTVVDCATDPDPDSIFSEFATTSAEGYLDSGLSNTTTYCYRVRSADNAGATSEASSIISALPEGRYTEAPTIIVSPEVSPLIQSAIVTWKTDREGSSFVEFGTTPALGRVLGQDDFVSEHSVTLLDLEPSTTYYYKVKFTDQDSNVGYSPVSTFETADAPSAPTSLAVTPASSTTNSFAFSWSPPADEGVEIMGYYYSVNSTPTSINSTYTTEMSLEAAAFATQQGTNTFYVVAMDSDNNVNYNNYASIEFQASTPAPAIPTGIIITDASNRETEDYTIALKWSKVILDSGGTVTYHVHRSIDGIDFTSIAQLQTTGYLDVDLDNTIEYFYYVTASDDAGSISAASSKASEIPEGRFTIPPEITKTPVVTSASFSALVIWETEREADSHIEYGITESLGEEQGTIEETEEHSVKLEGLKPETKYYYRVRSRDQDGNVALSTVSTFKTLEAPTISNVIISDIELYDAFISWETNIPITTSLEYGVTVGYGLLASDSSNILNTNHQMKLTGLIDGTTYHVRLRGEDSEGNLINSDDYSFQTLTFPEVLTVNYNNKSEGQTEVTWTTNVPTTSIVEYYNDQIAPKTQGNQAYTTDHSVLLFGLEDATVYQYKVKGTDQFGYSTQSDENEFITLEDTTPPEIFSTQSESNTIGSGETSKVQIVVSWKTDEPTTSQVEFGVGLGGSDYTDETEENAELVMDHLVVISGLAPAKTYHFRVVSADKADNQTKSGSYTVLTTRKKESFLQLIISNLEETFSWIGSIGNVVNQQ